MLADKYIKEQNKRLGPITLARTSGVEVMEAVTDYLDHWREQNKRWEGAHELYNQAMDIVINDMLREAGHEV